MADLPEISQNLDEPLPQVDPNSALVPYRMARTDPGGQPVVTTGYGPRARPPVQPPEGFGGGAGMPNLDQIYQAAFSKLPVREAVQASDAATRYVGLRLLNQWVESGKPVQEGIARYGYMILKSGTGVPEALQRSVPPPITPYQQAGLALRKQQVEAQAAREQAKVESAKARDALAARKLHVLSTGEVLQETGNPDDPVKVVRAPPPKPNETVTESYKIPAVEGQEAQPASKGFLGFGAHPAVPAVEGQPEKTIRTTRKAPTQKVNEVVRVTKDGKKAVFDANTKKFLRYAE